MKEINTFEIEGLHSEIDDEFAKVEMLMAKKGTATKEIIKSLYNICKLQQKRIEIIDRLGDETHITARRAYDNSSPSQLRGL